MPAVTRSLLTMCLPCVFTLWRFHSLEKVAACEQVGCRVFERHCTRDEGFSCRFYWFVHRLRT